MLVTIINKSTKEVIQNKVLWNIAGDKNDLNNLIKELELVKAQINGCVNRNGLALSDVDVIIENLGV